MDSGGWGEEPDLEELPIHQLTTKDLFSSSTIESTSSIATTSTEGWNDQGGWGDESTSIIYPSFNDQVRGEEVVVNDNKQEIESGWSPQPLPQDELPTLPNSSQSYEETCSTSSPTPSIRSLSLVSSKFPDQEQPNEKENGGWGEHGNSPTLAPIIYKSEESIPARDLDWGNDEERESLPLALPSFGDSFNSSKKAEVEETVIEEEGWGGAPVEWKPSRVEEKDETALVEEETIPVQIVGDGAWASETSQGLRKLKSIPAAFVEGIKENSRTFAKSTWEVPSTSWGLPGFQEQPNINTLVIKLSQPPQLPSLSNSTSIITTQTPLSNLFRLTPTLYPAFKTGLEKTALRSAETLKGTSSAAYRNARFGRSAVRTEENTVGGGKEDLWDGNSSLGTPVLPSDRGMAGDEFDLDGPSSSSMSNSKSASSWWGASGGQNNATNMPRSLLSTKKQEEEDLSMVGIVDLDQVSNNPLASSTNSANQGKIGRFFGRFGRNVSASDSSPATTTTTSSPPPSNLEPSGWSGDLGFLDNESNKLPLQSNPLPVQVNFDHDEYDEDDDDPLGSFFGDKLAPPRQSDAPVEFGGLLGTFGTIKPIQNDLVSKKKKIGSSLDPFDPYGEDEEASFAGPPTLLSSDLLPTSRAISPTTSYTGLTSTLLAPQARGVSVLSNFDSYSASTSPVPSPSPLIISPPSTLSTSILTPTVNPSRSFISSPPLIPTTASPLRSFTSPPPSTTTSPPTIILSSSISNQFNILPPPSNIAQQNRGYFAPPPPPPSFAFAQKPVAVVPTVIPAPTKYVPPSSSTSGPLGLDDLSFFES